MSDRTRPLVIAALTVLAGVGVLLLSFTIWLAADNIAVMRTHEYARAEAVRSERSGYGSTARVTYYAVVVRYNGPQGRRTARIDRTTSHYEPGEVLGIYYKPETPGKAIAGGFMSMWFIPTILGIPGLAAVIAVFFGLWPISPRRSPASP